MNTTLKPAPAGSVSTGTVNPDHLLKRFTAVLESLVAMNSAYFQENHDEFLSLTDKLSGARELFNQEICQLDGGGILDDLFDALESFAPENHYFGSHPGDGADFGFWPIEQND